jgi:hypothetical protein
MRSIVSGQIASVLSINAENKLQPPSSTTTLLAKQQPTTVVFLVAICQVAKD